MRESTIRFDRLQKPPPPTARQTMQLVMSVANGVYKVYPKEGEVYPKMCVLLFKDGSMSKYIRRSDFLSDELYYKEVCKWIESGEYFLVNGTLPLKVGGMNSAISLRIRSVVERDYSPK